ncbi:MAG: protein tyrosine phosphatase [Lachnospiraceae bacterium]
MTYGKIIFVSEENIFTSPVAETIMKKKLLESGDSETKVSSCGMVVLFPEPANPKGVAIAKSRGISMEEHRAKAANGGMFGTDVLVLVMSERIKAAVYEKYKNAVNIYTIKEFVGLDGDIETPYGKGMKEYGEVYTQLEELVDMVIKKLSK